ncbi:MAG: hypothetical protein PVH73_00450 [Candidatus Bathyarchaeota archaeon]|jgi:hypothetical protein
MDTLKKSFSCALIITVIVCLLSPVGIANFRVVHASTEVAGIIGADTTWTKANSPYSLTGNVLVSHGVTLTIEAGVSVNLGDYYIMVNGTLRAQGSSTDKIQFSGGEISFTQYSNGWDESSSSGCILENSVLSSAVTVSNSLKVNDVTSSGSIDFDEPGKPVISNSTLRGRISVNGDGIISNNTILDEGIILYGNATLTMNTISGCSTGILALTYYWDDSNPDAWPNCTSLIEGNLITGNTNGIIVREHQGAAHGRPIIQNNTIVDNSVGIYVTWIGIRAPSPTILYNNIYNNHDYNFRTDVPDDIDAAYNWWGINDTPSINQMIYDFEDDFDLGTVNFIPFLNEANPNIPEIIPEYSSWLLLLLLLATLLVIVICKNRLLIPRSKN